MDKELLAAQVMDRYAEFTTALTSSKRKYPMQEFEAFVKAVRLYAIATQDDQLIDRQVARVVTGLVDELTIGRKSVPGEMLYEADRLNCLLFLGYDPYFEGDEPPGLLAYIPKHSTDSQIILFPQASLFHNARIIPPWESRAGASSAGGPKGRPAQAPDPAMEFNHLI